MMASSSQFLGLRIALPTPPSAAPPSPRSATYLPSPRISAAYTAAAERPHAAAAASTLSPLAQSPFASLYDVLGLPADANCQEIKAAYRRLARACHPDVVATDRKGTSADEFIRIHAAYSTLSDPDKRADYDRKLLLLGRHRRTVRYSTQSSSTSQTFSRSPSFPGYGRRTWETDQCW